MWENEKSIGFLKKYTFKKSLDYNGKNRHVHFMDTKNQKFFRIAGSPELHRQVKMRAAEAGIFLSDWIVTACMEKLERLRTGSAEKIAELSPAEITAAFGTSAKE